MGRAPCCEKVGLKRGRWTSEEDEILANYIQTHGEGSWRALPKRAGLQRCGKSCRLRWINYLRGDIKRGNFTAEEEETIVKLHKSLGNRFERFLTLIQDPSLRFFLSHFGKNSILSGMDMLHAITTISVFNNLYRWSLIASHLAGRTDNEIKNYWNSHLSRKIYCFRSISESTMLTSSIDNNIVLNEIVTKCKRRCGRVSRAVAKKYNKNISNYFPRSRNHQEQIADVSSKMFQEGATEEQTSLVKDAQSHNAECGQVATPNVNVEVVEKRSEKDLYPQQDIDDKSDEILMHGMGNPTPPFHGESKECTNDAFILSPNNYGRDIQPNDEDHRKEVDVDDDEILLSLTELDIDKYLLSLEKVDEKNDYFGPNYWNHDATFSSSPTHFYLDDLWGNWNLEDSAQEFKL